MQLNAFRDNEPLISEKEEARLLNIHQRTLPNWRANGFIPFYKIGGRVLYRHSEVLRVLEQRNRRGAV